MKIKNLRVTKGNSLIESKYSRGLIETRIVDACIAQIDSKNELTPDRFFEIKASDLFELTELDNVDGVYHQLKIAAKNLIDQKLLIPETVTWINWFGSVSCPPGEGKIILRFSVDIKPYLFSIEGNFTSYTQKHTLKFKGSYSHRIYEFLRQWLSFGNKEFSIAELKDRLELENEYERIDDFKRRVINPAIDEINQYSDLWVKYTQRKTGRSVTHFCFTFGLKEAEKTTRTKANGTRPLIPLFTGHPEYKEDTNAILEVHERLKKKPEPKPKKIMDSDKKSKITGLKRAIKQMESIAD
jgi:plasmid replication initiation protein